MAWGTLGHSDTLEGASGRSWTLRFERRLAPREHSKTANAASSVWLVRDEESARLYAVKRQSLASLAEIDALVDEAAAWRAACLSDEEKHVVELVDVFVDRAAPFAVSFLAEFCSRGLLPKRDPLSEPVLLTLAADMAKAAATMPSPHAHISYESLLVDELGRIRLAGFGAHRSAILRDNPGLTPNDDAFDIGLLLYELMFNAPPPESLEVPPGSPYSPNLTDLVAMAFSHPHPMDLYNRAVAAGAEPHAPVVDVDKKGDATTQPMPMHVEKATERNVERLVTGVDIAPAFAALLADLKSDSEAVAQGIFSALFKKPISKDPLCTMRVLTMLHNLMLDGPDCVLAAIRKNDKFMDWAESSWTKEAVAESQFPEEAHAAAAACFTGGELAYYAAMLRRKAKFHMLAAGGFSGRWDRTETASPDGRDVLTTRRRKVVSGMADVIEMASELGCQLAVAVDEEAAVKHNALGALVSECCLAFGAAYELAHEVETVRDAEKVAPGISRIYVAARALVFAVEHVPSAGGEHWVEQFAPESPPDVIGETEARQQQNIHPGQSGEFPVEGWTQADALVDQEAEDRKREKREKKELKKKKRKEEQEAKKREKEKEEEEKEEEDIAAENGALVVHGADDASTGLRTMFGDLLAIDDGANEETPNNDEQGVLPDMSNSQALAAAFGVPEEAVGGQFAALPPPEGYDDDDGGYEDYKARQEEHQSRHAQIQESSNTAAWAARAGYGSNALVVSEGSGIKKKSHPVFCQCAICQQEELQAAAAEKASQSQDATDSGNGRYHGDYNAGGYSEERQSETFHQDAYKRDKNYYGDDDGDSLDGDRDDRFEARAPRRDQEGAQSYYQDDYDSYESVSYSVDEEKPIPKPISQPNAPSQSYHARTSGREQASLGFTLDAKLALNMKKLRMGDKISDTANVQVFKGEYNRETVAIKKLSKAGIKSEMAIQEFRTEVEAMCTLSNARLLKCVAASLKNPNFVFVTEYMKRGTLFDVLHKSRIKLTWALIRKIALQVAEGMACMHEQGFLHRDLKSLNILTDGSYNIKIGDFGLSCRIGDVQGSGISGTYQYMAPEVLRGEPHTVKSDVFSFAQILCEMISNVPPFQGMEARQVAERVVKEDLRPPIPMSCQRAYVNLIQMCWGTMPSTRPSFPEIVELIKSTTK